MLLDSGLADRMLHCLVSCNLHRLCSEVVQDGRSYWKRSVKMIFGNQVPM